MSSQKILESTAQAFANSWEMMPCPKGSPSSCVSIETGESHWESLLKLGAGTCRFMLTIIRTHLIAASSYTSLYWPSFRRNREVVWLECASQENPFVIGNASLLSFIIPLFLIQLQNTGVMDQFRSHLIYFPFSILMVDMIIDFHDVYPNCLDTWLVIPIPTQF